MTFDTNESADSTRLGRRKYLTLGAVAAAGLAGCSSDDSTETDPPSLESPEAVTRQFYTRLYEENDVERTNALYHPESPSPPLEASGFEPYGGLENIDTEIRSMAVASRADGRATVHATVQYSFPDNSTTATDYIYLRQDGEQWRVDNWLPEAPRRQRAAGTVEEFYDTLYNQNDLEAANAMYHPDVGGPLEASSFEPFGGLENIGTVVESTAIIEEGDGQAEVHADVEYSTPNGTNTTTDYIYLKLHRGSWKIDSWLPEAVRRQQATGTVEQFYDTLYNQNDIDAANAMYDSDDGGPLEASSFEPYGGLENIETTVESTEVVAEGDGEAEVHAEVAYSTPNGTNTRTDHIFLTWQQRRWRIDQWLPEAVREQNSTDGE